MRTLTPPEQTQRLLLRTIHDAHEKWRAGRSGYKAEDVSANLRITNEQRSRLEVLDFIADPSARYFAYVKEVNDRLSFVTTWTGETLATITSSGEKFRSGFNSERINFRCVGIDGRKYWGTYYTSSGHYCLMYPVKEAKP